MTTTSSDAPPRATTSQGQPGGHPLLGPDFEPGSDGTSPSGPRVSPSAPPEPGAGRFDGILSLRDGHVLLTAGGIAAEVLPVDPLPATDDDWKSARARAVELFGSYQGQRISLRGVQQGDTILRASPAGKMVQTTSRFDETTRKGFEAVVAAIKQEGDRLRAIPGVVNVRPGYRFARGWITDQPAIVISVVQKKDPSLIPDNERIPASLGGVPVDVKPATPLEQLQARRPQALESAVASLPPASRRPADLALPAWNLIPSSTAGLEAALESAEAVPLIPYTPPPGVPLSEVTAPMTVTLHASPDAGWPTLGAFLAGVAERLTIGMYDFTAPHILQGVESAMSHASGECRLILDPGISLSHGEDAENPKANDLTEDQVEEDLQQTLRNRFSFEWAAVRRSGKTTQGIYPSAYHIKVCVRDGRSFWLSSGNWQSSNQPNLDPLGRDASLPGIEQTYNREWHVILDHPGLADVYETFLLWDMEQARPLQAVPEAVQMPDLLVPEAAVAEAARRLAPPRYFPPARLAFTADNPLRIQPLLTPDNYADQVLPLIRNARETLYFQNQYIHLGKQNDQRFLDLVDALRDRIAARVDVRIILRDLNARGMLEALQAYDDQLAARVRLQTNCHNKGILIDSKITVIGSHNWSNAGALQNRDASLIFYDPQVTGYFQQIFLYDWENLARRRTSEEVAMPIVDLAPPSRPEAMQVVVGRPSAAPPGMMRIPWDDYYED